MPLAALLEPGAVLALGTLATMWDMRQRIVPNRLNLAGMAAGLALGLVRQGERGLLLSALGLVLAAVAFGLPWLLGGLGGGDLKLAIALGALAAWPLALWTLLAGAVAMALWSTLWALWARLRPGSGSDAAPLPLGRIAVPQAPALAAGAVAIALLAALR